MSLRWRLEPTPHDRAFARELAWEPDGGPAIDPAAILVFVNRSGSNHLADLLVSSGVFSGFREILNENALVAFLRESGRVRSFGEYVRAQRLADEPAAIWGLKASGRQLASLLHAGVVPGVLRPRIIHMRRRDLVAQAVSLYVARLTGHWHDVPTSEVPYDAAEILATMRGIIASEVQTRAILAVQRWPVLSVVSEDLLADQPRVLGEVATHFGCEPLVADPSRLQRRIQRTEVNEVLRERFEQDLADLRFEIALDVQAAGSAER